ncbi:MAG TPA: YbhB/YbcL family Raf kinase inhibitor-like protein [Terriglobales bacterium]|nr:YbhB/YbcL family Raf kinase inhibitor-like protein [Terriglobales bacterium]
MKLYMSFLAIVLLMLVLAAVVPVRGADADTSDTKHLRLSSTTFENNATLPLSMILNSPGCTSNGSTGGNESPELSWTNVPAETRSFTVIAYDIDAAFTHWGMFNIPRDTTELPQNAGRKGSPAGAQIWNDFAVGPEYDGPCPPTTIQPVRHRYVFTVYALDRDLKVFFHGQVLPPHFPALPEGLYHSLLEAGRRGHILESASISGFYSAAAPPGPGE